MKSAVCKLTSSKNEVNFKRILFELATHWKLEIVFSGSREECFKYMTDNGY